MSTVTQAAPGDFWEVEPHHHHEGASTSIGFWVYLMSDCLMFAVLFAVFGVLGGSYAALADTVAALRESTSLVVQLSVRAACRATFDSR